MKDVVRMCCSMSWKATNFAYSAGNWCWKVRGILNLSKQRFSMGLFRTTSSRVYFCVFRPAYEFPQQNRNMLRAGYAYVNLCVSTHFTPFQPGNRACWRSKLNEYNENGRVTLCDALCTDSSALKKCWKFLHSFRAGQIFITHHLDHKKTNSCRCLCAGGSTKLSRAFSRPFCYFHVTSGKKGVHCYPPWEAS